MRAEAPAQPRELAGTRLDPPGEPWGQPGQRARVVRLLAADQAEERAGSEQGPAGRVLRRAPRPRPALRRRRNRRKRRRQRAHDHDRQVEEHGARVVRLARDAPGPSGPRGARAQNSSPPSPLPRWPRPPAGPSATTRSASAVRLASPGARRAQRRRGSTRTGSGRGTRPDPWRAAPPRARAAKARSGGAPRRRMAAQTEIESERVEVQELRGRAPDHERAPAARPRASGRGAGRCATDDEDRRGRGQGREAAQRDVGRDARSSVSARPSQKSSGGFSA